jgi:hypothetical protein
MDTERKFLLLNIFNKLENIKMIVTQVQKEELKIMMIIQKN